MKQIIYILSFSPKHLGTPQPPICLITLRWWPWFQILDNTEIIGLEFPAAAKSLQSCLTLCDPVDGSPPASAVPGILQARTLEWVAISFSNAWKWKEKVKSLSHARLLATQWTAAYQAPPSMGFSRQEYWSGVPLPSPGIFIGKQKYLTPTLFLQLCPQFSPFTTCPTI